jgi:iron complex transport system permease protein
MSKATLIKFVLLLFTCFVAVLASLYFGGAGELDSTTPGGAYIFSELRVPKTLTAVIAGSSLAVAGLLLQLIFRNPLAGPYVLGISSGASLMVALGVLTGTSLGVIHDHFSGRALTVISAIAGGLVMTLLILVIARKVASNVVLLLIGLMFSQVCGAIQGSLEYFADPGSLKVFVVWGMGSLSGTTRADAGLFSTMALPALVAVFFFIKPLNALLLGQEYAQSMGVRFRSSRFYLILIASVLTGVTTAFCGPIAFVGIAVPILSRMIFDTSRQQVHLLSCMLLGSIILLFADAAGHSAMRGGNLPVNMITTFIGAPLVIYLMFRSSKW